MVQPPRYECISCILKRKGTLPRWQSKLFWDPESGINARLSVQNCHWSLTRKKATALMAEVPLPSGGTQSAFLPGKIGQRKNGHGGDNKMPWSSANILTEIDIAHSLYGMVFMACPFSLTSETLTNSFIAHFQKQLLGNRWHQEPRLASSRLSRLGLGTKLHARRQQHFGISM